MAPKREAVAANEPVRDHPPIPLVGEVASPLMELVPKTLREVEFREKLRGYNQDDVDEFLEQVAVGLEALQEQLRTANERANRAEEQRGPVSDDDDSVRRTLVLAQRTADMAIKEAHDQAAEIVAAAEARARAMLAQAEEAARLRRDTVEADVRAEVERLASARESLVADVTALEQHLDRARSRARSGLGDALRWLEDHLPQAPRRPELRTDPAVVAQATFRSTVGGLSYPETRLGASERAGSADALGPEVLRPDPVRPDAGRPDAGGPDAGGPDAGRPEPPGAGPGESRRADNGNVSAGPLPAPPGESPSSAAPNPASPAKESSEDESNEADRTRALPGIAPGQPSGPAASSGLFDADQLDDQEPPPSGPSSSPRF